MLAFSSTFATRWGVAPAMGSPYCMLPSLVSAEPASRHAWGRGARLRVPRDPLPRANLPVHTHGYGYARASCTHAHTPRAVDTAHASNPIRSHYLVLSLSGLLPIPILACELGKAFLQRGWTNRCTPTAPLRPPAPSTSSINYSVQICGTQHEYFHVKRLRRWRVPPIGNFRGGDC